MIFSHSISQINKNRIVRNRLYQVILRCCNFDFFSFLFFTWALTIYAHDWILGFQLKFRLDIFDTSLRLISGLYSYYGFRPYTDFGFVYPPGLLLLQSLSHVTYAARFQLFSIIFLVVSCLLISLFFYKSRSLFLSAIIVLILGLSNIIQADPFIEIFWISFIVISYLYLKLGKPKYRLFVFLCATAAGLFRWERTFALLLLMTLFFPVIKFFYNRYSLKSLAYITSFSLIAGILITLLFVAVKGSNLLDAFYFIVVVPIKILPYRQLPIPSINLVFQSVFDQVHVLYVGVVFYALFAFSQIPHVLHKDKKGVILFLLLVPFSVLPYATGRADYIHALPFLFTLLLSLTLYADYLNRIPVSLVLFLVYMISLFQVLSYTPYSLTESQPTFIERLDSSLIGCRQALMGKSYNSVFVGRTDYNRYYYNHAMLYLIDPSKKPATRYISDEPGLQNSCYDGMKISHDLNQAEKPMVAFLETEPQPTERNKSSSMVSCGMIENWLEQNSFISLGSCHHEGKLFAVRLYD